MIPGAGRYVARRLLGAVLVVWGSATIAFLALHLVSDDPVEAILGPTADATPALRVQVTADYGLDRPLAVQYGLWVARLLRGDLGRSYQLGEPVSSVLSGQVGPTVELALAATVVALVLAAGAVLVGAAGGRTAQRLTGAVEVLAACLPSYWLGLIGLTLFSFRWRLLPVVGGQGPAALVLPALALGVPIAGILAQVLDQGLRTALGRPFTLMARARGLGETGVVFHHAVRHVSHTLLNQLGTVLGALFGGTVVTETVFARPGLGRVLLSAVTSQDTPVVAAVVLMTGAVVSVLNLLVDTAHLLLDPRLARQVDRSRPQEEPQEEVSVV